VGTETLKHTHTLNVLLHCYNTEIDDHAAAVTGCSCLIFRLTLRMVTNSSAAEGWMPTTVSSCAFVTPIFKATAKPCKQTRAGHADGTIQHRREPAAQKSVMQATTTRVLLARR
jgi:hypothetical protein